MDSAFSPLGPVVSVQPEETGARLRTADGHMWIHGVFPGVVCAEINPFGVVRDRYSYALETSPPESAAVVTDYETFVDVRCGSAAMRVDKAMVSLSVLFHEHVVSKGLPVAASRRGLRDRRTAPGGEEYFGLGERMTVWGRRGSATENWATDDPRHHAEVATTRTYSAMPVFVGVRPGAPAAWGYFLDSPHFSRFDMAYDDRQTLQITVASPCIALYFIAGETVGEVVERYTELTGRHRMPPRWAMGFHQCRWGYQSTAQVAEVAKRFREESIPCDALWYDIDYMDGFRVFTFDAERFGDIAEHSARMGAQGFHQVAIIDPGLKVDPDGYVPYAQAVASDYVLTDANGAPHVGHVWPGEAVYPDFSSPVVRRWWGALHRFYVDLGIDGFWNDMNEPSDLTSGDHISERGPTVPNTLHASDEGNGATMAKIHNVYGLLQAKAAVEHGLLALRPDRRPFLLTRSCYTGIQKYAAKWGGDNVSTWDHLRLSIQQVINMGLSGVGFFGADVGGFGGRTSPELLVRWTQLGAFYPFFRNHTATGSGSQEPYAFDPATTEACRKAIALRYHLLPYIEQCFHELHSSGVPLMRPLFWHWPEDTRAFAVNDQFTLGKDLLVAPVTEPGACERMVYLPAGTWIDYRSGASYTGQASYIVAAPLDQVPLFVRAGAVVPVSAEIHHTGQLDQTRLTLEVFPAETTESFVYREDDGESNDYLAGAVSVHRGELSPAALRLSFGRPTQLATVCAKVVSFHAADGDAFPGRSGVSVEVDTWPGVSEIGWRRIERQVADEVQMDLAKDLHAQQS